MRGEKVGVNTIQSMIGVNPQWKENSLGHVGPGFWSMFLDNLDPTGQYGSCAVKPWPFSFPKAGKFLWIPKRLRSQNNRSELPFQHPLQGMYPVFWERVIMQLCTSAKLPTHIIVSKEKTVPALMLLDILQTTLHLLVPCAGKLNLA